MTKYYLHVGMHKTATKFFQHKVFPSLKSQGLSYNPPRLTQLIADLMKAKESDIDHVLDEIRQEKLRLTGEKKVVISREIMSGDLFSLYENYDEYQKRLSIAFPKARVILFLRFQTNWLVSCYRESLHEHHYQYIDEFLGIKKGDMKFAHKHFTALDLIGIVRGYVNRFSRENIDFFFFEDFKEDRLSVIQRLYEVLEISKTTNMSFDERKGEIPNRGYSAFSIMLSIIRYRVLNSIGLSGLFVHRPILFFGESGIPAGFEELSVLPADEYWGSNFYRDNEEIRSPGYPNMLTLQEKIKLRFSWRSIIKKGIDKFIYWDWDLAKHIRPELNEHFRRENRKLAEALGCDADSVPNVYLDKVMDDNIE